MCSVFAGPIEDLSEVLPTGSYKGQGCVVKVAIRDDSFNIEIFDDQERRLAGHAFSHFDDVKTSKLVEKNLTLKFVQHPNDGYAGKDVVTVKIKDRKVSVKVRDYGPLGLLFRTESAACDIK